jgi:UDP-N-acetylglucosamine 4,6-dehydratase
MKSILISGGSGSFGHAFVQRILDLGQVERLVVYSRDEQKQDAMAQKFAGHPHAGCLRFFIGDVRDYPRLKLALHGIDTVIHAAALKIVPVAEYNPTECVATNVGGAQNMVRAAIDAGVEKVIALSTDKAVNPINLYGATKLTAEKIFIAANNLAAGSVRFSVVRYGNVVGSRGSVVPLFQRLAAQGKAITITDKRMTRFWMTLDQSVDLVLLAEQRMTGREIFVSKIPSIHIVDLARAIAGNEFWLETGIRPGEKINEVLITDDESRWTYEMNGYFMILPEGSASRLIPVKDGFRYTSDGNDTFLTVEQIKEMLG